MPWYRFLGQCGCRQGCQGFKRPGEIFQYRIPGTTGPLEFLSDWQDVPIDPANPAGCQWINSPEIVITLEGLVCEYFAALTTVHYADQHARFCDFSWGLQHMAFPTLTGVAIGCPGYDLTDCSTLPNLAYSVGFPAGFGPVWDASIIGGPVEQRWKPG